MALFDDIGVAWNKKDGWTWFEVPRSARQPKKVEVTIKDERRDIRGSGRSLMEGFEPDDWIDEHYE